MTSGDTPDTLPWCTPCPARESGQCFRERASTLANAYSLGCRSADARKANAEKARERRARVRSGGSSGSLPDAWADSEDTPEREPTGETCECGSPLYWETGRGASVCDNGHWEHAPGTESRVIRESASREVELVESRNPVSLMAERAERARLRALRETSEQWLTGWIDTLGNPDSYDYVQWQQQARQLAALLRGFIPELRDAETESELDEIKAYVTSQVLNSDAGRTLLSEYEQAKRRMEYARERERAIALEPAQDGEDDDYEDDEDEDEDEDASEIPGNVLATPASIARQQYRSQPIAANGYGTLAALLIQQHIKKESQIAEKGACEFRHMLGTAVASRLYGVPSRDQFQRMNGYALPDTPQYRACSKHYDAAESRLNSEGYPDVCYWDLPLQQPIVNQYRNPWG